MSIAKLYLFLLTLGLCSCAEAPLGTTIEQVDISLIKLASSYLAGEEINIQVQSSEAYKMEFLHLIWTHAFGDNIIALSENNTFQIPKELAEKSGKIDVNLYYNGIHKDHASININALEAVAVLSSYTGPKSLILDQNEESMVVTIPADIYGNPMKDSYPVNYQSKHPKQAAVAYNKSVNHLVSHLILSDKRIAGKLFIGAQSGDSYAREQEILIDPGYAIDFKISTNNFHPYADQRQNVLFQTSVIVDKEGNTVADGTEVDFVIQAKTGYISYVSGQTIFGIAAVEVQNPSEADTWNIQAFVPQAGSSNKITCTFLLPKNQIALRYQFNKNILIIGPLKGGLSQLITDGTKVEIRSGEEASTGYTENGMVQFDLENLFLEVPKHIEIKINGTKHNIYQ